MPLMFICPHCNGKGVSFWGKLWSDSGTPTKCRICDQLSYVHSKYRFGFQSGWPTLVFLVATGLALYLFVSKDIVPALLAIPIVWLITNVWEIATLPLAQISRSEASRRNKFGYVFLAFVVASAALFNYWVES